MKAEIISPCAGALGLCVQSRSRQPFKKVFFGFDPGQVSEYLAQHQDLSNQALTQALEREKTLRQQLRESAETISRLSQASSSHAQEHLRQQLVAMTRESAQAGANLRAVQQENKQLRRRLAELETACRELSGQLETRQSREDSRTLALSRGLARMQASAQLSGAQIVSHMRETAALLESYLQSNTSALEACAANLPLGNSQEDKACAQPPVQPQSW